MLVDVGAQVVHDLLADTVRQVRLRHAEDADDDRDRDHAERQPGEQRRVVRGDRVVDHVAQEERRHHAERTREDDECEDEAEATALGTEQPEDAAQVRATDLRVLRALGLVTHIERAMSAACAH